MLKQAYLSLFNPPLTLETVVGSSFVREPSSTAPRKHSGGVPNKEVSILLPNQQGEYTIPLISFNSISAAADFLTPGRDRNYIKRYADTKFSNFKYTRWTISCY